MNTTMNGKVTRNDESVTLSLIELQKMEAERVRNERTMAQRVRDADLARAREVEATAKREKEEQERKDREEQARLAAIQSDVIELHKATLSRAHAEEIERVRRSEVEAEEKVREVSTRYASLKTRARLGMAAAVVAVLGLTGAYTVSVKNAAEQRVAEQSAQIERTASATARANQLEQQVETDRRTIALLNDRVEGLKNQPAPQVPEPPVNKLGGKTPVKDAKHDDGGMGYGSVCPKGNPHHDPICGYDQVL